MPGAVLVDLLYLEMENYTAALHFNEPTFYAFVFRSNIDGRCFLSAKMQYSRMPMGWYRLHIKQRPVG